LEIGPGSASYFHKSRYCTSLNPVRSNGKVSRVAFIGVLILLIVGTCKQGVGSGLGLRVISGTLLNAEHHFAPRT
jgi:hypothetical protein